MLRIRPFKISDANLMINWIKEERIFKMWCADKFNYPLTIEQLKDYQNEYEQNEFGWIFVALDEKGTPIGHFVMRMANYEKESVHLGFIVIDPKRRGLGYGKEMVELAVKYAFELLGVKRVTLGVYDVNPGAKQCYEKVGFVTETYHQDSLTYKDETWGIFNMAIERE